MTSGREINYSLRPAKSIERKMICEFLHRSSKLYFDISKYTYIGFGSFYFSDFALFHKSLGINKMFSIEKDSNHQKRYDFNKPYNCITMHYENSSTVLNKILKWDEKEKYFIWLDYDGCFSRNMVDDLKTCVNKLSNGSYICISFSLGVSLMEGKDLYDYLIKEAGEYVSPELKKSDVYNTNLANRIWDVLIEAVKDAIKSKNSGVESSSGDKYTIEPVMFFQYKDNAPMMTICYMLARENERRFLNESDIAQVEFYKKTNSSYSISVPQLTWLEVRKINSLLPEVDEEKVIAEVPFIEPADLKKYIKVYKYYPNYLEGQDTL